MRHTTLIEMLIWFFVATLVVVAAFLTTGCATNDDTIEVEASPKYVMECMDIGSKYERCENIEVVCYRHWSSSGVGVSCKFKEESTETSYYFNGDSKFREHMNAYARGE